jgi:hypothetical protein
MEARHIAAFSQLSHNHHGSGVSWAYFTQRVEFSRLWFELSAAMLISLRHLIFDHHIPFPIPILKIKSGVYFHHPPSQSQKIVAKKTRKTSKLDTKKQTENLKNPIA